MVTHLNDTGVHIIEEMFTPLDEDSCFDLNNLAHELYETFSIHLNHDAKQCLIQSLIKIAEGLLQIELYPVIKLAGNLDEDTQEWTKYYIDIFERLSPFTTRSPVRFFYWFKTDLALFCFWGFSRGILFGGLQIYKSSISERCKQHGQLATTVHECF
jgi:hypothetical protein